MPKDRCGHGFGVMAPGFCVPCKQQRAQAEAALHDFTAWERAQDGELERLLKELYAAPSGAR